MSADPNAALAASLGLTLLKPTLKQRFLRWLGFRSPDIPAMDDLDADPNMAAGCITVHVHLKLTMRDRFLVLLGGNIADRLYIKTSVPVEKAVTRGCWSVIDGGSDFT